MENMAIPSIVKHVLIGGSVYLLTQYGCKTVRYVFQSLAQILLNVCSSSHHLKGLLRFSSNVIIKDIEIHFTSSEGDAGELVGKLRELAVLDGFLGFDCEWVNNKPVALIQLSTKDGFCVLFHISKMESFPQALQDVLEDDTLLKCGVSPQNDAKLLFRDYQVQTLGCIDVRFFAPVRERMGLAALAQDHLNVSLDKSSRIRRSDWDADRLTEEQLLYAAQDAYIGALLFEKLIKQKIEEAGEPSHMRYIVDPYIGINFKGSHNIENKNSKKRTDKQENQNACTSGQDYAERKALRAYTPRKTPIYSNCKMLAPDGEVLCTCSKKKASWYVSQGLAKEVSLEPYQIQLLFEPAQRFRSPSGLYYIQDKVNQCVVCGKKDSHLRKNVVPHEYRRHFPDAMKKHQSHDVLPLCQLCHLRSNSADISLRQKLAVECNALIGVGHDVKATENMRLKKLRSAARALLHGGEKISEKRREELLSIVKEEVPYYEEQLKLRSQVDGAGEGQSLQSLPAELLMKDLTDIDISIANENYIPHGLKVTEHFSKDGIPGLMRLEKMWREHFVETMKPGFLPQLWSTSHYHHNERVFVKDEAFQSKMEKIKIIENQS